MLAGAGHVVVGGDTDPTDRYIAPTVLTAVDADAPIMREEIFGPLLPVLPVDDVDAAIEFVNGRDKPLALYVFSEADSVAARVIESTSAGGVAVNATVLHLAVPGLPFGGVGPSGMGAYHGRAELRDVQPPQERAGPSDPARRPGDVPALPDLEAEAAPPPALTAEGGRPVTEDVQHLEDGWGARTPADDTVMHAFVTGYAEWQRDLGAATGARTLDDDDVAALDAGSAFPLANGAVVRRPVRDPAWPALVERARRFYAGGPGDPWALFSSFPTPDLRAHCLELVGHPPFMVRPPGGTPPPDPPWLTVVAVQDSRTLADSATALTESYPAPDAGLLTDIRVLDAPGTRCWVGYVDGRPVATAAAHTTRGCTHVEWISAHPDVARAGHRRRVDLARHPGGPERPGRTRGERSRTARLRADGVPADQPGHRLDRRSSVAAELDQVPVGIADVHRPPNPARAEHLARAAHDVEATGRGERVEIGVLDHEAEVVDVGPGALRAEEVDDRRRVDPGRREEHLAAPELVEPDRLEPELLDVPRDGALHVGDVQDDVIECDRLRHVRSPRSGGPGSSAPCSGSRRPPSRTTARTGCGSGRRTPTGRCPPGTP